MACRIKREEDRLKREIEERELKEAEELLAKTGKGKKLKEGEKLDKNAIMQVIPFHPGIHVISACHVDRLHHWHMKVFTQCVLLCEPFQAHCTAVYFLLS